MNDSDDKNDGMKGSDLQQSQSGNGAPAAEDEFERDQQAHQNRGQSAVEGERD